MFHPDPLSLKDLPQVLGVIYAGSPQLSGISQLQGVTELPPLSIWRYKCASILTEQGTTVKTSSNSECPVVLPKVFVKPALRFGLLPLPMPACSPYLLQMLIRSPFITILPIKLYLWVYFQENPTCNSK